MWSRSSEQIYPFPWTRGNFADSLHAGYSCWVLRDAGGQLLAYAIVMLALDEAHLLNLSVARDAQRAGLGWRTLQWMAEVSREHGARTMLLEVRPSNPAAHAPVRALWLPAHRHAPRLLPGEGRARGCHRDAYLPVTLDLRRARLWEAMGLGPVWTLRAAATTRTPTCGDDLERKVGRMDDVRLCACELTHANADGVRRGEPQRGVDAGRRGAGQPRKMRAASHSWARRADCSTTCSPRSD